jgi:hypothetical protein
VHWVRVERFVIAQIVTDCVHDVEAQGDYK